MTQTACSKPISIPATRGALRNTRSPTFIRPILQLGASSWNGSPAARLSHKSTQGRNNLCALADRSTDALDRAGANIPGGCGATRMDRSRRRLGRVPQPIVVPRVAGAFVLLHGPMVGGGPHEVNGTHGATHTRVEWRPRKVQFLSTISFTRLNPGDIAKLI